MWHQHISPWLAAIFLSMVICSVHPFRGGTCFGLDDWIVHLIRGLDLDDQLLASGFDREIRLV